MTYLLVIGGTVAAGAVPVVAYIAYRTAQSRSRQKEAARRRQTKIDL